ncbi:MAG: PASTA domain-containing protein [Planctomycetes bacterium]|nr:PASTA domain-containing protein [Planctomycetota bacterium]
MINWYRHQDSHWILTALFAAIIIITSLPAIGADENDDPWVDAWRRDIGKSTGDLTPRFGPPPTGEEQQQVPEGEEGAADGETITDTKRTERTGPITLDTLDPARSDVATHIRKWIKKARPPQNAVPGASVRYSPKGNSVGSVPGGTIRSPHDGGKPIDPVFLWKNRRSLDSVDHCTMEEYVVAKLKKNESISHCKGRYGGVRDFTGERLAKAKEAVKRGGFKPFIAPGSPAGSQEEEGTIEKQEPDWKKPLKKGETIKLVVHSPYVPPGSVLPDFTGKPVKEAREWLKDNNFKTELKPGSTAPSPKLSGAVEAQEPAPGTTLIKGAKVVLTVHSPFVDVREVPNVEGLTAREAKKRLKAGGFDMRPLPGSAATSKDKSGTVESQSPSPRTKIEAGSIVEVRIHSVYVELSEVPNVVGLSAGDAKQKLTAAGFVMKPMPGKSAPSKGEAGKVQKQHPEAGAHMDRGARVSVTVYGPYIAKVLPQTDPKERCKKCETYENWWEKNKKDCYYQGDRLPSICENDPECIRIKQECSRNKQLWDKCIQECSMPIPPVTSSASGCAQCQVHDEWLKQNDDNCFKYRSRWPSTCDPDPLCVRWKEECSRQESLLKTCTQNCDKAEQIERGKVYKTIVIPDIKGLTASEAKKRITDAGLKPAFRPGGTPKTQNQAGTVERQSPSPGINTGPGAEVAIFVYGPYVGKTVLQDEVAGNKLTAKTIVGYWNFTGEASDTDTKVYGNIEFFQGGSFHLKATNKQQSGEVDHEEGKGTWELVGDQLTFGGRGGIKHKGNVQGDPSAFTMHDTAGWTLRFKKSSRTGGGLTYPDSPVKDDPIDAIGTFGQ